MPRLQQQLHSAVTSIHLFVDHWLYRLRLLLGMGTNAPIIVVPYLSYGRIDYIHLQGRVLKEKRIVNQPDDSDWQTLKNNFKRAWSVEIRNALLTIQVGENYFKVKTDKEGYFKLDSPLDQLLSHKDDIWQTAKITLVEVPWRKTNYAVEARFIIPNQPNFGVISDIDDTVIETKVNSVLKLKMIYLAFFKNATKRFAFSNVSSFYQSLYSNKKKYNPIFYVSKSPWNIADYLEAFLILNQLPLGPLLLRDYGLPYQKRPADYKGHKYENIVKILQTYPDLSFILVGDSGEKDIDIYLGIAALFPKRIKCIYIHDVNKRKRVRTRIKNLIDINKELEIKLISSYQEATDHAISRGWIDKSI